MAVARYCMPIMMYLSMNLLASTWSPEQFSTQSPLQTTFSFRQNKAVHAGDLSSHHQHRSVPPRSMSCMLVNGGSLAVQRVSVRIEGLAGERKVVGRLEKRDGIHLISFPELHIHSRNHSSPSRSSEPIRHHCRQIPTQLPTFSFPRSYLLALSILSPVNT